jgi:hypothetical protein
VSGAEACFEYMTLLNLRDWQEVTGPGGKHIITD